MTRIISGRAGGVRLDVPPAGTRPTSDRVRESLFSALEATGILTDASVADLYAGSGALGLESLSRGAARCDLVEKGQKAADIARRNAARVTATGGQAAVHAAPVQSFLRTATRRYDVAFLDPPYDVGRDALADDLQALRPLLTDDALVIVETATRTGAPDWSLAGLRPFREKRYGDTSLWWGEPAV